MKLLNCALAYHPLILKQTCYQKIVKTAVIDLTFEKQTVIQFSRLNQENS